MLMRVKTTFPEGIIGFGVSRRTKKFSFFCPFPLVCSAPAGGLESRGGANMLARHASLGGPESRCVGSILRILFFLAASFVRKLDRSDTQSRDPVSIYLIPTYLLP